MGAPGQWSGINQKKVNSMPSFNVLILDSLMRALGIFALLWSLWWLSRMALRALLFVADRRRRNLETERALRRLHL